MKKNKNQKRRKTPGPKPEIVKIEGDWRDAVKRSFEKHKPSDSGWKWIKGK